MAVYLFTTFIYLLLLSLIFSTLCVQVCANSKEQSVNSDKTVELFKNKENGNIKKPEGKECISAQITVENYYSPLLLLAGDVVMAVAGVNYKEETTAAGNCVGILTKYIKVDDETWENIIASTGNQLTTQFAFQDKTEEKEKSNVIRCLLGVATNEKIYLLMANHITPVTHEGFDTKNSELKLVIATVNRKPEETIIWNNNLPSNIDKFKIFQEKLKDAKLTDDSLRGSAFLTKEGIVVFALVVQSTEKRFAALIHLEKDELKFVYENIDEKCYPFFFQWENKIVMLPTKCSNEANKKIMESDNIGVNFSESKGQLTHLWGFLKDKHNFITVTIENKSFLLFAEEKNEAGTGKNKKTYLWITDGSRVNCVGEITTKSKVILSGSLLYTNNELFALHKKQKGINGEEEKNIMSLTQLKEQQESIAKILEIWKKNKEKIEELCKDNAITKLPCSTEGLVGFLSDTSNENDKFWQNKYSNVGAVVTNGVINTKGFTFSKKNAGATWSVGTPSNDQPYNFADSGFTLVVTVSIEKHTEKTDNSILGVGIDDKKAIRLWCTNDGKWKVSKEQMEGNKKIEAVEGVCEQEKTYQLVVTLNKETKKFLVYVDGEPLNSLTKDINMDEIQKITYLYFGVDTSGGSSQSTAESHVKVSNVLLYNRPFESKECKELKTTKSKNVLPILQENNGGITQHTEGDDSTAQKEKTDSQKDITDSSVTLNSQNKTTESISLHSKESAVNVTIIISNIIYLFLPLLVVGVGVCEFLAIA